MNALNSQTVLTKNLGERVSEEAGTKAANLIRDCEIRGKVVECLLREGIEMELSFKSGQSEERAEEGVREA